MKVAVGLRRVAAGKRTSGRRAAQIAAGMHDLLRVPVSGIIGFLVTIIIL